MRLLLLAAVFAVLALAPGAAAAAVQTSPDCWKDLLHDYADNGRIDDTYAAACYREAIRRMPNELSSYSDAYDVLTRALASATAHPHRVKGVLVVKPPSPPPGSGTTSTGTNDTTTTPAPFTRVTNKFTNAEPDRVPVPLLVLAGLGLLFVAAGVAGAVAKRRRGGA